MIIIVNEKTNEILFRVDAWVDNCMEQAAKYIKEHGLKVLSDNINFNGDMIVMVR